MTIYKNEIEWGKTDALIFDMDGTLWDAVDSYCKVWIECLRKFGIDAEVKRDDLIRQMGKPLDVIYQNLFNGKFVSPKEFMPELEKLEIEMMPKLGGIPYPGVHDGSKALSEKYSVMLLSNCGADGLNNLMRVADIERYITKAVTFGETQRPKDENLRIIKRYYNLSLPGYVGDTLGDCDSTHAAGMPFAFAEYGFGTCADADISFKSFTELTDYFLSLK